MSSSISNEHQHGYIFRGVYAIYTSCVCIISFLRHNMHQRSEYVVINVRVCGLCWKLERE
jgi:hypothetical protein